MNEVKEKIEFRCDRCKCDLVWTTARGLQIHHHFYCPATNHGYGRPEGGDNEGHGKQLRSN